MTMISRIFTVSRSSSCRRQYGVFNATTTTTTTTTSLPSITSLLQQQQQQQQQRSLQITRKQITSPMIRSIFLTTIAPPYGQPYLLSVGTNVGSSSVLSYRSYHRSTIIPFNNDDNEYPPHTIFPMPALSPTMETGSIASWNIHIGDTFNAGDSLCTIETDKASVDYEAQDDGILAKILVQPGMDVPIGTPICIVTDDMKDISAFEHYKGTSTATTGSTTTTTTTTATKTDVAAISTAIITTTNSSSSSILFPSARHLAQSHNKDATQLMGSGKGGRVTKSDVQIALTQNILPDLPARTTTTPVTTTNTTTIATSVVVPPPVMATAVSPPAVVAGIQIMDIPVPDVTEQVKYDDISNNKMRKIIASRLTASKRTVPHCYVSIEIALDDIMILRKQLQKQHNIKISVNDCIIRACALALRDVPQINHTYDTKTETIVPNTNIDVSVAVATPTGLITPIVFHTDQLGLYEITNRIKDLATRARDGQLQPHEYQGGTFSISNLGMFGITAFSAVINPPQAAILAVGGGTPTIVPIHSSDNDYNVDTMDHNTTPLPKNGEPPLYTIQNTMTAQLSADRRVIDEATAAQFLQVFRHYMQKPELLIL